MEKILIICAVLAAIRIIRSWATGSADADKNLKNSKFAQPANKEKP